MTDCSKAAVITGGGTGVGRAATLRLARAGYGVVFNYLRSQAEATETAEEVAALGGRAVCLQADVASDEDCRHH
jgi:3-oxoacyl-[acyl-carrier protein] reductase